MREEILGAARGLLLGGGLSALTLSAVGKELGLTKAALYYYFPSKEALVFELIYASLEGHASYVGDAIDATTSGGDAIEALIRASAEHYGERMDEVRLAYMVPQVTPKGTMRIDEAMLERVRPFNERMYGAVAQRIARDQAGKRIPKAIDGRRLAFVAHTSVLGMLMMEGLVDMSDDPLIHRRAAMVADLVETFRARLTQK